MFYFLKMIDEHKKFFCYCFYKFYYFLIKLLRLFYIL